VDARAPKVKLRPAIPIGNASAFASPSLVFAMKKLRNRVSSTPCAMASDPGTARRACTPVKPPNQASCTWLLVNAVTAAG